jgi:hypothetical protein
VNLFVVGGDADALLALAPFFPGRDVVRNGRVAWLAHEDGYVGAGAMFSGRPIVWRGDTADGRAPLDPSFWLDPPVDDLDGRYVGVRVVGDEVTVFADALGAYPVYRRDGAVSNNAYALRGPGSLRLDVLASLLGGGWSLSGNPVWEGVEQIQPQRPDVEPNFDPDRAAALLVATVRALADWPGRPSVVPVTAGRDSRVVLAAALAAGIEFETTTGGEPGHPDVEIGRELARVAGVPWKPIEHDPHGSVLSDWRRAAELLWLMSSGTASLADAAGFPFGPRPGPLPLWHSGQGGEIARSYYGTGGTADHLYHRFVGRRPGRTEILNADGERLVREQIDGFADEHHGDLGDLFYLHRRMGTWAGPTHGAVEFVRDTTSPLWSRRLLPDLLGGRGEFHERVLERLAPQLLDVPYESARTVPRKVAAALKRRIRPTASPFDRILAEVREAVLGQPHHDAWHVLDRPRVERLLASAPAALDEMSRYYVWRLATVFGPTA